MYHLALIVFDIHLNEAMRVGPKPFRHGALHRKVFICVERRGAVVCEQWNGNAQNANSQRKSN